MSKDAKQSLIALGSVLLIFAWFAVGFRVLDGIEIPRWVLLTATGISACLALRQLYQWIRARRTAARDRLS